MAEVEDLIKTTLSEIERILSTKSVIGDPITVEGNTIIPLVSVGFGFGGGGSTGKGDKDKAQGTGSGTGGGGGIKPVGVVIINKDGVKVEPIRGRTASVVESVTDVIGKIAEKRGEKKKEAKQEG